MKHPAPADAADAARARRAELLSWALLAVALGSVEGGTIAVVAQRSFEGAVPGALLHDTMAILTGVPSIVNLLSVLWSRLGAGPSKVALVSRLQALCATSLLLVALAPGGRPGLALVALGAGCARGFWSGVIALRSSVWRARYGRDERARVAGRVLTISSLVMAVTAIGVARGVDGPAGASAPGAAARWIYLLPAIAGLAGAWLYRRTPEPAPQGPPAPPAPAPRGWLSPLVAPLRDDRAFRRYEACVVVFLFGNLMALPAWIVELHERFGLSPRAQVLLVSSIPVVVAALSMPLWTRLMARRHAIGFRAVHSWSFVLALVVFAAGALAARPALLWAAAVLLGVAYAGGSLGWHLGHHDFAPPGREVDYMGAHAVLTGVCGLLAPVAGIRLYRLCEGLSPGAGRLALLAPALLSATGAIGFWALGRGAAAGGDAPRPSGRDPAAS